MYVGSVNHVDAWHSQMLLGALVPMELELRVVVQHHMDAEN